MLGLYAIIDPEQCRGREPLSVADAVLRGGCAALQLRAKKLHDGEHLVLARALAERCRQHQVPFWINDRVDLALLCDADGLHLGQNDLPVSEARRLLGNRLIGLSTHTLEQAQAAAQQGANVIGVGPIFPTLSKHDADPVVGLAQLGELVREVRLPVVAIGGIKLEHAAQITASGAAYAAAIGAICGAEDPEAAARTLHHALLNAAGA